MTLMFRRAARNFIRKGYFPTDDATLERILGALAPAAGDGPIRLLDPTCGEGSALAEVRQHLGSQRAVACGIEIDADRARHAEGMLDPAIHADLLDCRLGRHGFGKGPAHPCGYAAPDSRIIHCYREAGAVVEQDLSDWWRRKLRHAFRVPGIRG